MVTCNKKITLKNSKLLRLLIGSFKEDFYFLINVYYVLISKYGLPPHNTISYHHTPNCIVFRHISMISDFCGFSMKQLAHAKLKQYFYLKIHLKIHFWVLAFVWKRSKHLKASTVTNLQFIILLWTLLACGSGKQTHYID